MKQTHTPAPWRMNGDHHVYGPQKRPTTICATVYERADAVLIAASPDLLRENEAACGSLDNIISNLANVETDEENGWCRMDADQLADELRLIRVQLENVARKATGE